MSQSDVTSSTSPPERRRKQTIMGDNPPDLQVMSTEVDVSVPADDRLESDERIDSDKVNGHIDVEDEHTSVQKLDNDHENGIKSLPSDDDVFVNTNGLNTTSGPRNDENANNCSHVEPPNDIVYDETKPKRLHHPRPAKLDIEKAQGAEHNHHALRESISFLISPDEPEENVSPTRRRRKQLASPSSSPTVQNRETNLKENSPRQPRVPVDVTNGAAALTPPLRRHYDKSPELPRRKVSSPVQRLIVKNGQVAQAVAANSRQRKSSTEGRLNHVGHEPPKSQRPVEQRRRKISSDARLEHRKSEEELLQTLEKARTRKVSFDTTALFNGNKVNVPLNDGPTVLRISLQEEPELYLDDHVAQDEQGVRRELGARPKQRSQPRVVFPGTDDVEPTENGRADKNSNSDASEDGEEGYASGCDNRAYIADDEDSLYGRTQLESPSTYQDYDGQYHENADDAAAVIPHTETYDSSKILTKQRSCSSLPASFGRRVSDDDSGVYIPKSILKVRPMDADSMVSEDSIPAKSFKVRKDSIALFMDTNTGNVSIEELRKEFSHRRWKCFGKNDVKQLWVDRKQLAEKYKLHLLVMALFAMTFAFVIVGLHFHSKHHNYVASAQKVFFDAKARVISLIDYDDIGKFKGKLGFDIPGWKHPTHCYTNYAQVYDQTCLKWKEHGTLDIVQFQGNHTNCYNVSWSFKPGTFPFDCFYLGHGEWYGPVNASSSQWPIRSDGFTFNVNNAKHHGSGTFASAVEYYWLSSHGEAIIVDSNYPIEINWNQRRLGSVCIIGKDTGDFYSSHDPSLSSFHYTVCNGRNILDTHKYVNNRYFTQISDMPPKSMLEFPHWSSVLESDHTVINDTAVQQVAESIVEHGMNCSTVEINGKWERNYGDLAFDPNAFRNITDTINAITRAGCGPSLNVYPFFNSQSSNFQEGVNRNFFIKNVGGEVTSLLRWQHGIGAMLDATNPEARDWFTEKLRRLSTDYDINSFTLSYGKHAWVPSKPIFSSNKVNPNNLKLLFSNMISSVGDVFIQSTSQSQHMTSLLSITTRVVRLRNTKCIKNIIPDVLTLGLMGYPFVLSDGLSAEMKNGSHEAHVNRDLFIRWMQVATFFPAMRYTIKPWGYDKEVVAAARNLTDFHSKIITDAIYRKRNKILAGDPIIKPMWWLEPNDRSTMVIDDQFMVADTYLVAPILCDVIGDQADAARDIYIPKGVWKDMITEKIILGPRWLRNYKASLFHIPHFERMAQYDD